MHKFYVILVLLLGAPLIANKQHGSGAGPSGEEQLKSADTVREFRCPKCGKEISKGNQVYCVVKQDKHNRKCGHWVCKNCQDKMQSSSFWTWS